MTSPLAALIFDVDGTLAETEEAHRVAFNEAFRQHALPWEWDLPLYKALLETSGGKERMRAYASRFDQDRLNHPDFGALVDRLHRDKTGLYTQMVVKGGVPLRPGIQEVILEARSMGIRLAVATTTTRANVNALLEGATKGAGHEWFEMMACSDDAPNKKPDPQVYNLVLTKMGLAADACLAIEDSLNGVNAAVAAGIPVVVTKSQFTESPAYPGALGVYTDLSATSLADLHALLR